MLVAYSRFIKLLDNYFGRECSGYYLERTELKCTMYRALIFCTTSCSKTLTYLSECTSIGAKPLSLFSLLYKSNKCAQRANKKFSFENCAFFYRLNYFTDLGRVYELAFYELLARKNNNIEYHINL